jgi:Xaa-Pro dipeptidase
MPDWATPSASPGATPVTLGGADGSRGQRVDHIADLARVDESAIRVYGLSRARAELTRRGVPAALLFDPLNVRYTVGSGHSFVYQLHNAARWALVPVEGDPIVWEPPAHIPALNVEESPWEMRPARAWLPLGAGPLAQERARGFASEVRDELERRDLTDEPLAVDRVDTLAFLALQDEGLRLTDAQLPLEIARAVKCDAEVVALRNAARICDFAIETLRGALVPGVTENDLWAIFNGTSFRMGAEYNETRLLSSGPRTNPWFQEATMRSIARGELVAFDTDLVGPSGYLADISRTYLCGDGDPTSEQRRLHTIAYEFIAGAIPEFKPGTSFAELGEKLSKRVAAEHHPLRYPFIAHGSGLADEYPAILFDNHHDGQIEPNLVFSVEIYIGEVGGTEGVKLEEQILVTPDGPEILCAAPYDNRLL